MKRNSPLCLVALVVTLILSAVTAPASAAETSGPEIVYSDTYLKLIAAFPSGVAPNECEVQRVLSGATDLYCGDLLDPVYFYPDGTLGSTGWFVDSSSPTGWSPEPDPCMGLTDQDADLWYDYLLADAYGIPRPDLTEEQIDQYSTCWGWW